MLKISILLVLIGVCNFTNAQNALSNSLLWRISGKGLKNDSYLFGTFHSRSPLLFNFKDSVYSAIKKTTLFATEVDDDDFNDFRGKQFAENLENEIANETKTNDVEKNDKNKKKDKVLAKQFVKEYVKRILKDTGSLMPFIIDGYWNKIAIQQKSKSIGLEDIEQIKNIDLFENSINDFAVNTKEYLEVLNGEYFHSYINEDINKLFKYSTIAYSKIGITNLLYNRNVNMIKKMESCMVVQPSFFAVGAAHLSGDSGIINLLIKKGYIVTPVQSKNSVSPINFDISKNKWFVNYTSDSSFLFETPKKSNKVTLSELESIHSYSIDLTTRVEYISMEHISEYLIEKSEQSNYAKKLLEKKGYFIDNQQILTTNNGFEYNFNENENFYKIKLYIDGRHFVFLIAATTESKQYLEQSDVLRFLNSYKNNNLKIRHKNWSYISDEEFDFKVNLPKEKIKNVKLNSKKSILIHTLVATDSDNDNLYKVIVYKSRIGYHYAQDSSLLNDFYIKLSSSFNNVIEIDTFTLTSNTTPKYVLIQKNKNKIISKHLLHFIGSKLYYFSAYVGKDTAGFSNFFNSINITDTIHTKNWIVQKIEQNELSIIVPSKLIKDTIENLNYESYSSYDSTSALTYFVYKKKINPFIYYKNDSSFFMNNIKLFLQTKIDSLATITNYSENGRKVYNVVLKFQNSIYQRVRYKFFVNGDTLYCLSLAANVYFMQSKKVNDFFQNYSFSNNFPYTYLVDKTSQLFENLNTTNKKILSDVIEGIEYLDFKENKLNQYYNYLLKTYPTDTLQYESTYDKIVNVFSYKLDSSFIPFLIKNYDAVKNDTIKSSLLFLLANCKEDKAYKVLNEFLTNKLPNKWSNDYIAYALKDSLQLSYKYLKEPLFKMLNYTAHQNVAFIILDNFMDSGYIKPIDYLPYSKPIIEVAKKNLINYKNEKDYYFPSFYQFLTALSSINSTDSKLILEEFSIMKNNEVLFGIIQAQAKTVKICNQNIIINLCSNDNYRDDVYEVMKLHKIESQIPKVYLTQENLARAYLHNFITDDGEYELIDLKFVKRILKKINNKSYYFYIFKVKFEEDGDYFLGLVGAFELDANKLLLPDDLNFFYLNEDSIFNSREFMKDFDEFFKKEVLK